MYKPAPPAMLISYPSYQVGGSYSHCDLKLYATVFYQSCAVLLQPKTTTDFHNWIVAHPGFTHAMISAAFTMFCTAAGLGFFSAMCGIAGLYYALELTWYTNLAAQNRQCLRIRFNRVPAYVGAFTNLRFDNYGQWERWIYYTGPDGLTWRTWGYPTSCKMWLPTPQCTPEGGCTV